MSINSQRQHHCLEDTSKKKRKKTAKNESLENERVIFVLFWCPFLSPIFWPSSSQIFLTFRCLYENWGSDNLPQGVAKVIADVFRDFNISLEWVNEPFFFPFHHFFFFNVGRTKEKTGEDNHFSLLMWIIFSLSQMLSQIGLRTSVLAQPETGGSGLGPEAAPSSLRSATETWCIWPWASHFPSLGLSCLICKMRELD